MAANKKIPTRKQIQDLQRLVALYRACCRELASRLGLYIPVRFADAMWRANNALKLRGVLNEMTRKRDHDCETDVFEIGRSNTDPAARLAKRYVELLLDATCTTLPEDFRYDYQEEEE